MEEEQAADEVSETKFLDVHVFMTAAIKRTSIGGVGLQTAIDILHKKVTCFTCTILSLKKFQLKFLIRP